MPAIKLILDGDKGLEDWKGRTWRNADEGRPIRVLGLAGGMTSGNASVAFAFELDDGSVVFAQTSLRLFGQAADALRAKYPEILASDPHAH